MKVSEIMKYKQKPLITVKQGDTAQDAVRRLVANNIGALPVCDTRGRLVGILSERDILRKCGDLRDNARSIKIKDMMITDVAVCVPEDEIDYVMNIMNLKGIRHLPVMQGGELIGMISVRDIIEARLEACQVQIRYLSDYISGNQ